MEARVIAIGPFSVLKRHNALLYPIEFYEDVPNDAIVVGAVAYAKSSSEVNTLVYVCNVEVWNLGLHKVTKPKLLTGINPFIYSIGNQCEYVVYLKLVGLLDDGVDLWFIPIG